jgi:ABC-type transport system involved in cytochrome bd biosynthesis fused ATPase/permease subunit
LGRPDRDVIPARSTLMLVLDRGRVVEHGTHTDLLERGGLYTTLYEQQFRADGERPAPAQPTLAR